MDVQGAADGQGADEQPLKSRIASSRCARFGVCSRPFCRRKPKSGHSVAARKRDLRHVAPVMAIVWERAGGLKTVKRRSAANGQQLRAVGHQPRDELCNRSPWSPICAGVYRPVAPFSALIKSPIYPPTASFIDATPLIAL